MLSPHKTSPLATCVPGAGLALVALALIAAPLTASPLSTSPLGASPLSTSPLGASPAGAAPLHVVADATCDPMVERMPIDGRVSPYDSTFVQLGQGEVKICYGRPSALGRTLIGGEPHPFGAPWRLGANEPTTLHTDIPIRFGDVALAAGSYSLYAVPGADSWEIVVNAQYDRWGIPISPAVRADDIGSVTVPRMRPPAPVETLTLQFGSPDGGTVPLVIEWEEFRVVVPVSAAAS